MTDHLVAPGAPSTSSATDPRGTADRPRRRRSWFVGLLVTAAALVSLVVAAGRLVDGTEQVDDPAAAFGLAEHGDVSQGPIDVPDTGSASGDEPTDSSRLDDDGEEPLESWRVDGDELVATTATAHASDADSIWDRFAALIPRDEREMVVRFELLDADFEGAFVYPTDGDPSEWVLGVSLGLGEDLDSTLVHEFGHLLTLGADEVPPGGSPGGCTTYFTGEGCALEASTFARYVDTFWSEPMIAEALRIEAEEDWDSFDLFYELHAADFVTDYASTNPGEDLAETFMVFVLEPRPSRQGVTADKLLFLWQDPEMVELREEIRADL